MRWIFCLKNYPYNSTYAFSENQAISGTVEQIGKDVLDNPYISFSGEFLQSVTCYFSKDDIKTISQISKGDKITIIGECTGLTLTNVVIQDSKISQ